MYKICIYLLISMSLLVGKDIPFRRGVNLTGWFQTSAPGQIQFTKFTKTDFINLKNMGIDHIRLPINLHSMTSDAPDYNLDPLFLFFLDQVVDMAEELGMHLILDNHSFDPAVSTATDIDQILIPVWTQMAEHYKERSNYIYYEILNEPHGISDSRWNEIQQEVIDVIRSVDSTHTIVIGPAGWNSYNNLQYMPAYSDTNLIYTFHFYDPFLFTHQGASWTDPSMVSLAGVPFPYESGAVPPCPQDLIGTYIQSRLNNYSYDGTISRAISLMDIAVQFQQQNDVPMFCGEFGVYIPNSDNNDRVFWHNLVRSYFEQQGIGWSIWSYDGGFGIFEPGTDELFDYDLNVPLVEAIGLTAPPQSEYVIKPDTSGFPFYTDYIETGIKESSYMSSGSLSFYSENEPYSGKFCIDWEGAQQYNDIGFNFTPDKDLSVLQTEAASLNFRMRSEATDIKFDVRFIDSKTDDPEDHPWRMRFTIDESVVPFDGNWHLVAIPLEDFTEHGAWDNEWFPPQGDFDWTAIDRFEIVAENMDLTGKRVYFDDIKIILPGTGVTNSDNGLLPQLKLYQNYPNPFNPKTIISYQLNTSSHVELNIYNNLGEKVRTLVNRYQQTGDHLIEWNAEAMASGIYYYELKSHQGVQTRKMILLR